MPRDYWDHLKTDQECINMINFLVERTKNVQTPLMIKRIAREFQKTTETSLSFENIRNRIQRFRDYIPESKDLEMDTKVKLLIALSVPIQYGFLLELKEHGDVKLDNRNRIIEYKKNGGGLELRGLHYYNRDPIKHPRVKLMFDFLAELCRHSVGQVSDSQILRDFKFLTGDQGHVDGILRKQYRAMKNTIYGSMDIDKELKIKMLFVSNAKLHDRVIEELRKDAIVELDNFNRIVKYHANDGSLNLVGDPIFSATLGAKWLNEPEKKRRMRKRARKSVSNYGESTVDAVEKRTKSGRISKKQHLDTEFSYDFCDSEEDLGEEDDLMILEEDEELDYEPADAPEPVEPYEIPESGPDAYNDIPIKMEEPLEDLDSSSLYFIESSKEPDTHFAIMESTEALEAKYEVDEAVELKPELVEIVKEEPGFDLLGDHCYSRALRCLEAPGAPESSSPPRLQLAESSFRGPRFFNQNKAFRPEKNTILEQITLNSLMKSNSVGLPTSQDSIQFLESIYDIMTTLGFPSLQDSQLFIEKKIRELESGAKFSQKITFYKLSSSVLSCFSIISEQNPFEFCHHPDLKEATSTKEFLKFFRNCTIGLNFPTFDRCQQELKEMIENYSKHDKKIPTRKVVTALQTILDVFI